MFSLVEHGDSGSSTKHIALSPNGISRDINDDVRISKPPVERPISSRQIWTSADSLPSEARERTLVAGRIYNHMPGKKAISKPHSASKGLAKVPRKGVGHFRRREFSELPRAIALHRNHRRQRSSSRQSRYRWNPSTRSVVGESVKQYCNGEIARLGR